MIVPKKPSAVDRTGFLRLVAVYKFVQAALLVGVGLAALRLVRPEVAAQFAEWVQDLPVGYVQRTAETFLQWVSGPQSSRALFLSLGIFAYAALFLVESVGLWFQRRWAEWLTVVATGALIPPEIYECATRPSTVLFILLTGNVLVVALLVMRIRHEVTADRRAALKQE
jgi:uncharacterized membrane protein (DUF2068 family)